MIERRSGTGKTVDAMHFWDIGNYVPIAIVMKATDRRFITPAENGDANPGELWMLGMINACCHFRQGAREDGRLSDNRLGVLPI